MCCFPSSSTVALSALREHPLHLCLSPTPHCACSLWLQPLSLYLCPADASAPPSSKPMLGPHQCYVTGRRQPSPVASRALGGGLSLPSPVHLPWAELALEVAQSSPITSGACLCSQGWRINYQGCGAVDHSSYYFLLLQIGVVESSVPFNPRSSVYFPAGSTNAVFPITSQRASDRSLHQKKGEEEVEETCCNCLFFSIFKHF